jgi:hypothetical protein
MGQATDARRVAPAAERNKEAILAVLREVLPQEAVEVLEVAAGTGQHALHFAAGLPHVTWWPCEFDRENISSIEAYRCAGNLANMMPPQLLDVTVTGWAGQVEPAQADLILCCNMIHIAPWGACLGLVEGAGVKLNPGGALMLYGPFRRDGVETAPSNEAFDASLKARNPEWGVRRLEQVVEVARAHGLELRQVIEMPANNLSVVFKRTSC